MEPLFERRDILDPAAKRFIMWISFVIGVPLMAAVFYFDAIYPNNVSVSSTLSGTIKKAGCEKDGTRMTLTDGKVYFFGTSTEADLDNKTSSLCGLLKPGDSIFKRANNDTIKVLHDGVEYRWLTFRK